MALIAEIWQKYPAAGDYQACISMKVSSYSREWNYLLSSATRKALFITLNSRDGILSLFAMFGQDRTTVVISWMTRACFCHRVAVSVESSQCLLQSFPNPFLP
jgi:hypothetical protein